MLSVLWDVGLHQGGITGASVNVGNVSGMAIVESILKIELDCDFGCASTVVIRGSERGYCDD